MDKDLMVVEYLKIFFQKNADQIPDDPDEAFQLFMKLHKKYKGMFFDEMKQKSEKYVDRFFNDQNKKKYY